MTPSPSPPPPILSVAAVPELRLVHVDDELVVADKPAGLLCVPGRGADKADCLHARVVAQIADARVVHRLDMATSGLVVFGRGAAAQRGLSIAFAERRVDKTYEAVVDGIVDRDEGGIDLPLAADWPRRPRQMVDPAHGKPSQTHWQVLSRDPAAGTTRLALLPTTGRSHQLRVHLAAIGHPIVGDALYGAVDDGRPAGRLLLHACALTLPALGARRQALRLHSPVPF